MINVKETLQNLHKEFPEMSLDDLFKVLDCYKEDYTATLSKPHYKNYEITYTDKTKNLNNAIY